MNHQIPIFYVCLIFLFSVTSLRATTNNLDSLYQEAKLAYLTNVDKALGLTQQVIDGARQKKDSVMLWQGLQRKGIILQATADFTEATSNFQAALAISSAIKDNCGIGHIQTSLSNLCLQKGVLGDGLIYADSAIAIFEKYCPNKTFSSKALINKGCILVELENYQEAKRIYQVAKSLTTDQNYLTTINENLAIIHYYEDNYQKAKDIYFANYEIYQELKDINSLAQVSNSLGALFYELNDFEKAKEYFNRSFNFSKQVNSKLLLVDALINLGNLEMELGNIEVADNYRIKVDEIIEQSGGIDEKLQLAVQSVTIYDYLEMYEAKSQAQEKVLLLSDSFNLIANQELLADKLADLNVAQKEAAIQAQRFFIACLALGVLTLTFFLFYFWNKAKHEKITHLQQIKERARKEEEETRKKVLEASFQAKQETHKKLHDQVSNPLSVAANYIESFIDDPNEITDLETANQIVNMAYDTSRKIAHELLPFKIDWVDRINLSLGGLERAKNIDSVIHFNRKNINHKTFSPEKGAKVAAIIGNLLVNVEKHAEAQKVVVDIHNADDQVIIKVEDDGIGFDTNQPTGIGLLSIKSNIDALQGTFSLDSTIGKGTKATVFIPTK